MAHSTDGIIHGRTIELTNEVGLADGQRVHVTIEAVGETQSWGEGILRSAGALADCDELDAIFATIQDERKRERRTVLPQ